MIPPALVLVVATAITLAIAIIWLGTTVRDAELLGLFLLLSGGFSLVLGYGGLALAGRWRSGLGVKLAVGHVLGAIVVLLNVVVTAVLMFISGHDIGLLGLLVFFAAALSIFFGFAQGRFLIDSIDALSGAARRMATGDLNTRVAVPPGDELGELGDAFNRMAARLQEYDARQRAQEHARRDLIVAVSHDLRTPLASIRAMAEALCDGVVTDRETVDRYHRTIKAETERLNGLIENLFELSRIDAGAMRLDRERVSLHDLISDILLSMAPWASRKNLTLEGSVPDDLAPVCIDAGRIQRVLVNLIENAIRHTPERGRISLTAVDAGAEIRVDVADTGEGIADADLALVFERFYRGEKSRSREGGGAGLGLAITRGLVEAHGGRIWVTSKHGEGCTFSFTLPKGGADSLIDNLLD